MDFQKRIRKIYDHISDEQSKEIFGNRIMFSLSGDEKYIIDIIKNSPEGKLLLDSLGYKEELLLFGAGVWGREILRTYSRMNWKAIIDNNYTGAVNEAGLRLNVYSFDEMKIQPEQKVVISSRLYHKDIKRQLLEAGISKNQIIDAGRIIDEMSKKQYFDLPELQLSEDEIFVDAGSFDGLTSVCFNDITKGMYRKIYAFEPDEKNLRKCRKTFQEHSLINVETVPIGLWNKTDILSFDSRGNGASKIENEAEDKIKVDRLDNVLSDEQISFIKMDLEGAEYNALSGAREIISRCKPKLAISVYHKPEDIWELPDLILSISEEYQFYFRHYSISESETIIYAIPEVKDSHV